MESCKQILLCKVCYNKDLTRKSHEEETDFFREFIQDILFFTVIPAPLYLRNIIAAC